VCARVAWPAWVPGPSTSPLDSMRAITATFDLNGFFVRSGVLAQWLGHLTVGILAFCAWNAAHAESLGWALAYEGKDNQSFLYDPRAVRLISRSLGIASSSREMLAFHGVPAPVNVVARRYVWSSSCEAHQCPFNRGFFWLDSDTGETLAARATVSYRERGVLMIGGSLPSIHSVSPEALETLRKWIAANDLHFESVQYRPNVANQNSRITTLDPAEYSAAGHPATQ
jgi:hypothetical protein